MSEFFSYGVNTLLFQRGVYPPETFSRVSKYGLTMLMSTDPAVQRYLRAVLAQMRHWLSAGRLRRVVVVFAQVPSRAVVERWAFDVDLHPRAEETPAEHAPAPKPHEHVVAEIRALVRQITASVTFLPLLEHRCSFDMLIYTDKDTPTPVQWEESPPNIIHDREMVQLRSFSTNTHHVQASVSYVRAAEDL